MPAPSRRNVGASLAQRIGDHSSARGAADDRDRLVATRARQDKKWEENAARLDEAAGATLERRAAQACADYERAAHLSRYSEAVHEGRAKPPTFVRRPAFEPGYFLGPCLRCSREMWVHSPKPRVPICKRCRDKR